MKSSRTGSVSWNSTLNFVTQIFVVVLAFLCVPLIVGRLGSEQFGLLSLLWMFVGYFGVFDLGLGQASVKFLAESVARGDSGRTASLIRATGMLSLALGLVSGLAATGVAVFGVDRLLSISPPLVHEATQALFILALGLPAVLLQSSLRSVPMAFNRFDIVNGLQAFAGILQWAGASVAVLSGGGVFAVVVVTIAARYLVTALYALVAFWLVPEIRTAGGSAVLHVVPKLLGFGGWVSVNQIAAPLLTFIERMMIGSMLGLAAVTFYAVPAETVSRMQVIPMSIVTALFPMISAGWVTEGGRVQAKGLYERALKYVALLLLPVVFCFTVFAGDILRVWLGVEFERQSAAVLSILAVGMFFNAVAQLPFAALQALGRPELPARIALVQIPVYLALLYVMMRIAGVNGMAIAWFTRVVTEAVALFYFARVNMRGVPRSPAEKSMRTPVSILCAGLALMGMTCWMSEGILVRGSVGFVILAMYLFGAWKSSLDKRDMEILHLVVGRFSWKRERR